MDIYTAGSQKFPALLAEMATAEKYIHLMYLIWEMDELTAKVKVVLLDRLKAGVKVHILYDWLSCISYKKDELKELAAAGAVVMPCYKRLPQINYRNHMKMVIIDGKSVYSGGMNMGQEYIDGGPRFDVWRDTSFRLSGPVVAPYLMLFASTWLYNGGKEDLATDYMPPAAEHHRHEGIPVQVLHSSVQTTFKTNRDVFITALTNARERIWIQSPYFVPDEPLITAMCTAAASGIDVRFMMTGMPDKKIPFYAAQAYYPALLRAGVKVYQYKAGFLHSKTVTVDHQLPSSAPATGTSAASSCTTRWSRSSTTGASRRTTATSTSAICRTASRSPGRHRPAYARAEVPQLVLPAVLEAPLGPPPGLSSARPGGSLRLCEATIEGGVSSAPAGGKPCAARSVRAAFNDTPRGRSYGTSRVPARRIPRQQVQR